MELPVVFKWTSEYNATELSAIHTRLLNHTNGLQCIHEYSLCVVSM